MGGFASILGEAAQGYNEAAQKETQRTFAAEMDRRAQMVDLLGKLASDETAHPETRQAAFQQALDVLHTPHTKVAKPDFNKLITTAPSRPIASSQPPTQPFNVGDVPMPVTPPKVTLESPPSPPGMRYTPEEQTQMAASRIGAVTGAEAGAQAKFPIITRDPQTGELKQQFASGTGQPTGQTFENAFSPNLWRGMASMMHPVTVVGPSGTPMPALQDKLGLRGAVGAIYDQDGQLMQGAEIFAPSLNTKTTTDAMGLQSTVKPTARKPLGTAPTTAKPVKPDIGAPPVPARMQDMLASQGITPVAQKPATPAATQPATKKPAAPATQASPSDQPGRDVSRIFDKLGLTPKARENVSAAMDKMMNEGTKPDQKFNKVEQLAYTALQRQGITPPLQGTEATRTMADKGKIALGLIQDARRLIAANPDALGPLSGSWSKLQQKFGSLEGAPKQLAGTLISLYSVAGGMHGWRAIRVADEFQNTYGGIGSTPASLESGLKAMENTANLAIKAGYPGRAGEGMTSQGAQTSGQPKQHAVGDVVRVQGKRVKITAIHPDGSFDGEDVR